VTHLDVSDSQLTSGRRHNFDHLVGAREQRRRHLDADCSRRLQVDDEFVLSRLLDCELGDDLRAVTF
jgi:hypothetical protein